MTNNNIITSPLPLLLCFLASFILPMPEELPVDIKQGYSQLFFNLLNLFFSFSLIIGWPLLVKRYLDREYGLIGLKGSNVEYILVTFIIIILLASVAIDQFFLIKDRPTVFTNILVGVGILGAWSYFYIIWTVSKSLVYLEEGKAVTFNFVIGTFLQFFFLIIGVYFICRRLRKLELKSSVDTVKLTSD